MQKLSDREWMVLEALWQMGDAELGTLVEQLRPHTDWNRNTVLTYLTRMEAKGLITRTPAEEGGKRNEIALTERGRQICEEMSSIMPGENAKIFEGLSQDDMETAARLFLIIKENLAQ